MDLTEPNHLTGGLHSDRRSERFARASARLAALIVLVGLCAPALGRTLPLLQLTAPARGESFEAPNPPADRGPPADAKRLASAARAFMKEHRGDRGLPLRFTRIQRSEGAGASETTVTLDGFFHGIAVDNCGAWVTFRGETIVRARWQICSLAAVPRTEQKVISRHDAAAAMRAELARSGKKLSPDLQRHVGSLETTLVLRYVLSHRRTESGPSRHALSPNWSFPGATDLNVDAYTGEVWSTD